MYWIILFYDLLLLWQKYTEISKLFSGSALMGSALLKALAEEADREEEVDLSQDLSKHAE